MTEKPILFMLAILVAIAALCVTVVDVQRTVNGNCEAIESLEARISDHQYDYAYDLYHVGDHVQTNEAYRSYFNQSVEGEVISISGDILAIRDSEGEGYTLNTFWMDSSLINRTDGWGCGS